MPSAVKASWAKSSSVMSTTVEPNACPLDTCASISARAPMTAPPAGEIGNSSEPASRRMRAAVTTMMPARRAGGSTARQAMPQISISTRWNAAIASSPRQPSRSTASATAPNPYQPMRKIATARPASAPAAKIRRDFKPVTEAQRSAAAMLPPSTVVTSPVVLRASA